MSSTIARTFAVLLAGGAALNLLKLPAALHGDMHEGIASVLAVAIAVGLAWLLWRLGSKLSPPTERRIAQSQSSVQGPELWNPNAAANWSLLLSPAFGAYLQMVNWQEMGNEGEAAKSRAWFIASVAALVLYALVGFVLPDSKAVDGVLRIVGFALLLGWYFSSGRGQATHVKNTYGSSYVKRGWSSPLLVALAAGIAYFLVIFVVAFAVTIFRR